LKDKTFKEELFNKNMRTYKSIVEEPDKFENDHDVYLASLIDS
jgi:hypothetical protein